LQYLIAADRDCQGSAGHLPRQFTILSGNLTEPERELPGADFCLDEPFQIESRSRQALDIPGN